MKNKTYGISFRCDKETEKKLMDLAMVYGQGSKAEVLRFAIHELHKTLPAKQVAEARQLLESLAKYRL